MLNRKIRVRFAPSPTGTLHIGGVRTALYNYLFAHHLQGEFILRIEDTDQTRYVEGAENYIMESLRWLGIEPSESPLHGGPHAPYRQSERKSLYRQYADQLILSGNAYYAFDTPDELEEMRNRLTAAKVASPQYNAVTRHNMKNSLTLSEDEVRRRIDNGDPYVIRIKLPRQEEVRFHDIIRGWIVVHTQNMDDKVLFKSDGMPTYHLANVVDDYLMQITHVIRGEEWLPSAPLHVLLYKYLGWESSMPEFAHLPLILKPDGNGKLSKRDGDRLGFPVAPLDWKDPFSGETTSGYREKGYFPEAVINFLALLGWNPGTTQELFSLDELVHTFSLERVSKAGAKFDYEKAKWFNQQYLWKQNNENLAMSFDQLLSQKGIQQDFNRLVQIVSLVKERAYFVTDFISLTEYFFNDPSQPDQGVINKKWNDKSSSIMSGWKDALAAIKVFTAGNIEESSKRYLDSIGVPIGQVLQLFRVFITGMGAGPGLFDICELLGKETVIRRLEKGISSQTH